MSEYYITRSDRKRKIKIDSFRYGCERTELDAFDDFADLFYDVAWEIYHKSQTNSVTLKLYEKGVKKPISTITIEKE